MILPVVVFQDKFPSNNDIYFCLYRDYDQVVSPKSPQQIWILENPLAQRKPKCSYRQQESIMCPIWEISRKSSISKAFSTCGT